MCISNHSLFSGAFAATYGALKTLQLGGVNPGGLSALSSLQSLQTLTFDGICPLKEKDLQQVLRSCKSLAALRVRDCNRVGRGACERLYANGAAGVDVWWAIEECSTDDEEDGWVRCGYGSDDDDWLDDD